jgi:predicted nucleic acid-binding Zn ribbon protein
VYAPPAISFKGSGFYATDHGKRKPAGTGEKTPEKPEKPETKSDKAASTAETSPKKDAKPAKEAAST